jgi:hypothetical protein
MRCTYRVPLLPYIHFCEGEQGVIFHALDAPGAGQSSGFRDFSGFLATQRAEKKVIFRESGFFVFGASWLAEGNLANL